MSTPVISTEWRESLHTWAMEGAFVFSLNSCRWEGACSVREAVPFLTDLYDWCHLTFRDQFRWQTWFRKGDSRKDFVIGLFLPPFYLSFNFAAQRVEVIPDIAAHPGQAVNFLQKFKGLNHVSVLMPRLLVLQSSSDILILGEAQGVKIFYGKLPLSTHPPPERQQDCPIWSPHQLF